MHPDQFLEVLSLKNFLGEIEGRRNVALSEANRLIANLMRAGLSRRNPIFERGNYSLSRAHKICKSAFGMFDPSLSHGTQFVRNPKLWGWG